MTQVHLHLVSDSTGETIHSVARACLAQFEGLNVTEHLWSMARTPGALRNVLDGIASHPGFVLYTLVNDELRSVLEQGCRQLNLPCLSVLDPVILAFGRHFGMRSRGQPGRQHQLSAEYFGRIEAMEFALRHDDGQGTWDLKRADVILVGVSRTSKTPTCMYLANRGIRAANVPIVPGVALPADLDDVKNILVVGLTKDPSRLVQVRRNRLEQIRDEGNLTYTDIEAVKREVTSARRLFTERGWPVIDVTRRSIEETAASVLTLLAQQREVQAEAAAKSRAT
jgi:[pyruvate, water dikinase]-phosphate phosphotransferase / [pyruvate, water dikinase] kinase